MTRTEATAQYEARVPTIPSGWEVVPFNEAAEVVSDQGKRIKQRDYLPTGKIPIMDQGQEFVGGYTDDEELAFDGDLPVIIFGDHTRAVKYVDRRFAVGAEGVKILKPTERYAPKFLYYFLRSLQIPSRGYSRHFQFLRRLRFPVAPKGQQDLIVAEIEKQFSRLYEGVANLTRVKANLKRYRAAVLKAAVEGRLVPTEAELARREGRTYETGGMLLERVLDKRQRKWNGKGRYREPLAPRLAGTGRLPEGWVWATVEQLTPAQRPCAYGVLQPGDDVQGGVPFVRVGDIKEGRIAVEGLKRIAAPISERYPRTRLEGSEVLITLVGAIGRTAVVPKILQGANVARAVGVIPLGEELLAPWVELWFRNPRNAAEMSAKAHEVARKTLNLEDVRQACVAVPPLKEQQRASEEVERRLSMADEIEAQVDADLWRADTLRQSLLRQAFSSASFSPER